MYIIYYQNELFKKLLFETLKATHNCYILKNPNSSILEKFHAGLELGGYFSSFVRK